MEIILLKDIDKLGDANEVVTVKNGYGRNYLIPKGLGVIANNTNRSKLEARLSTMAADENRRLSEYQAIETQLNGVIVKIGAKAGQTGKIFGSVTNIQIAQALKEQQNLDIERKKIVIEDEVKELGVYSAKLTLHPEVIFNVTFEVIAD